MAKSLDDGIHTDVIYLDMAKAFYKVPLEKLLYKLEMIMESIRQEKLSIVDCLSYRAELCQWWKDGKVQT